MPGKSTFSTGVDSEYLGKIAENTFESLLNLWFGRDIIITADNPDHVGVDRRCVIHNQSNFHYHVPMHWQIKARSIETSYSKIYKREVFVLKLKKSEKRTLRYALSDERPVFIALAIPRAPVRRLEELAPEERFDWYAIDFKQFQERLSRAGQSQVTSIHIPCCNRLNLSMISLLWGSLWFSKLTRLIHFSLVGYDETFVNLARALLWNGGAAKRMDEMDMKEVPGKYQNLLREKTMDERAIFNLIFGTSMTHVSILDLIYQKGDIQSYRVYAVESLGPGFNLWLFSKQVRSFFREVSQPFCHEAASGHSRMFPFEPGQIKNLGKYLRAAYFNLLRIHGRYRLKCGFVHKLEDSEPTDHLIMEGIGTVRAFVHDQTEHWRIDQQKIQSNEIDLLDNLEKETVADSLMSVESILSIFDLRQDEVFLASLPLDLLAPEDLYLEHPFDLV